MITFQPLTLFRWQLYSSQGIRNKWTNLEMFGDIFNHEEDEEDRDPFKEALLDTSPYLLGLTVFVSIFHSVFEFLAFKNGKSKFFNNLIIKYLGFYCFIIFIIIIIIVI